MFVCTAIKYLKSEVKQTFSTCLPSLCVQRLRTENRLLKQRIETLEKVRQADVTSVYLNANKHENFTEIEKLDEAELTRFTF